MIDTLFLSAVLAALAAWNTHSLRRYKAFKQTDDPARRMAFYRHMLLASFALLGLASLGILAVLGRLDAIWTIPAEFAVLHPRAADAPPIQQMSLAMLGGFATGAAVSLGIMVLVWRRRLRSMRMPVVGDIEALLPRDGRETLIAIPLSINAGISEELFFRLALPLLIVAVTGSALIGLGAAAVVFGLMHWYQGWRGVLVTGLVGAFFGWVYVASGSLIRPVVLHILVDLMALVVRPSVSRLLARRFTAGAPALS
jgi:membrane protease YdiL (CAAX protease family)